MDPELEVFGEGRVLEEREAKKHEIFKAAFGNHLFVTYLHDQGIRY